MITAANSSQISDGSAALLITTSEKAAALGLTPIARIHTAVLAGAEPMPMLHAPIPATQKALAKSGLSIDDIGAFEVNEAFAPVPLAWLERHRRRRRRRSTPTAARSPSATRSAAPAPG